MDKNEEKTWSKAIKKTMSPDFKGLALVLETGSEVELIDGDADWEDIELLIIGLAQLVREKKGEANAKLV